MKQLRLLVAALICGYSAGVLAGDAVDMGIAEFKAGKYRAALRHLQPAAEAGNADAQFYMGRLYAGGRAGVMDDFEAANWFEKSARQDNAEAQYQLARLYLSGWGLSKDPKAAKEWLWKSGRLGFVKAQLLLGDLLSAGEVVPQDLDAARLWYAQAASQGSIKARTQLEKLGGAAALPDGGAGLSAPAVAKPEQAETLDADSRAAIVRRRIEELKSARKGEANSVAPVAVAVAVQTDAVVAGADQRDPDTASVDAGGSMATDELVLDEFETDDQGLDAVLEMDAVDDAVDQALIDDRGDEAGSVTADAGADANTDADNEAPSDAKTDTGTDASAGGQDAVASSTADNAVMASELLAPATVVQPVSQSGDAQPDGDALRGRDWVLSRDPAHYTIQLLGSWKRGDALAFADAYPLPGVGALVQTRRHGKPWFSLYYGDFASFSKAVAVQAALKGGIAKHGPWVRPYRKIQAGLK